MREYLVEIIGIVVENSDGLTRESIRYFKNNTSPSGNREIAEFFHSDKEADSRFLDFWIVFVEFREVVVDEVSEGLLCCKCLLNELYVAFYEIYIAIMYIRVFQSYIKNM